MFGFSESVSAFAKSVALWSVAGVGYSIRNMWRHWLLGLVRQLALWLETNWVPGRRLDPGAGS